MELSERSNIQVASVYEDPNRLGRWLQVIPYLWGRGGGDTMCGTYNKLHQLLFSLPAELRLTRGGFVLRRSVVAEMK